MRILCWKKLHAVDNLGQRLTVLMQIFVPNLNILYVEKCAISHYVLQGRITSNYSILFLSSLYVSLLVTGLLSHWESIGCSFHAGPVQIAIFAHIVTLLCGRVQVCTSSLFSFTEMLMVNFKIIFSQTGELRSASPGSNPRSSALKMVCQIISLPRLHKYILLLHIILQ